MEKGIFTCLVLLIHCILFSQNTGADFHDSIFVDENGVKWMIFDNLKTNSRLTKNCTIGVDDIDFNICLAKHKLDSSMYSMSKIESYFMRIIGVNDSMYFYSSDNDSNNPTLVDVSIRKKKDFNNLKKDSTFLYYSYELVRKFENLNELVQCYIFYLGIFKTLDYIEFADLFISTDGYCGTGFGVVFYFKNDTLLELCIEFEKMPNIDEVLNNAIDYKKLTPQIKIWVTNDF